MRCSVLGCKSDSERKIPDISFHIFPEDDSLKQIWIQATGRSNWTPRKSSKICSNHFEKHLLIKKKKTFLLPNAVPFKFKDDSETDSGADDDIDIKPTVSDLQVKMEYENPDSGADDNIDIKPTVSDLQDKMEIQSADLEYDTVDIKPSVSDLQLKLEIDWEDATCTPSLNLRRTVVDPLSESSTSCARISTNPGETGDISDDDSDEELSLSVIAHARDTAAYDGYTPQKLKMKLRKAEQLAAVRLKKLKALREKNRRLTKKIANLENMVSELKAKSQNSDDYLLVIQ